MINSIILDDFIWSFSRLNSFYQCKHQFKLQYINCDEGEGNFFSEYGTHLHNILEMFAKGELECYELSSVYKEDFDNVIKHPAPPNKYVDLRESYYNAGLNYLNEFEDFGDYEIVEVEKEFIFEIEGIKVKGVIDLLVRDKDGNLIITDHKSSDPKTAKSEKAKEYWKQMYLYSIHVKEEYGTYPVKLCINAFRKGYWLSIDFDEKEVEKVKKWVLDTVDLISKEEEFKPTINEFFCKFLCNFRNTCEYRWGTE